jgi:hypothetical protein
VQGDEGGLRHLDEVCAKVDLVDFDINIWRAILAPPHDYDYDGRLLTEDEFEHDYWEFSVPKHYS